MKATSYDKDLKQDKDGTWYRWLGVSTKGTKQQFRLGKDKREATRRFQLIVILFEFQVELAEFYGGDITWCPKQLKAAKDIAKGKPAIFPRHEYGLKNDVMQADAESYVRELAYLNRNGEIWAPEDSAVFSEGLAAIETDQSRNRLARSKLVGTNPDRDPTGQNIGQAVDAFVDYLNNQNTLPDGSLSPWGKTQITQVMSWRNYMAEATERRNDKNVNLALLETDLADLTVAKAQQMVDATRKRPLTFESKKTRRMAPKSAQAINKKIRHFFDWLDLSDDWHWWEPPRFRKLLYKVSPLTNEEKHQRKMKKERWCISDDEIKILYELATPVERILILLGLNCAFGAGEIGNLRIPYVKFDTQEIDGIRFKTGNDTRHYLWPETIEGLQWELNRRETLPKSDKAKDIFFLTEKGGEPLWSKTKAGNYKNGINKRWNDLMKRVKKDHPKFYRYSFGKLRKTAAIRVIELADAESASMILAHGIPSEDKLLTAYVTIPWKKLYAAQEEYGETIRPLLKTSRPPFEQPPKNYIGKKASQILEQHKKDVPALQIARSLEISTMTVYRHLERAGLRKNGQPNLNEDGN